MNRDISLNISTVQTLPAGGTSASGNGVDLQGFDAAAVVAQFGTASGAVTITVQESDSVSTGFANVAAADIVGAFVPSVDNTVQEVGYIGTKRYIRAVASTGNAATTVCVVRAKAAGAPV